MADKRVLPHKITYDCKDIKIESVGLGYRDTFIRIDDEYLISSYSDDLIFWYLSGLFMNILFILIYIMNTIIYGFDAEFLLIISIFLALGTFVMFYNETVPEKVIIFHRLSGIVEVPGWMYRKKEQIMFENIRAYMGGIRGPTLSMRAPNRWGIGLLKPNIFLPNVASHPQESWCFLVWYMDRTRPLPPLSIFEPYQEKDKERRKKEGDVPHLYPKPDSDFYEDYLKNKRWRSE